MEHPLVTIMESGSKPMQAAPIALVAREDVMEATALVAEVMAYVKATDGNKWAAFALRIAKMHAGGRASFLSQMKADKGDFRKALLSDGIDEKRVKAMMASFTVQLSRLESVARAFNAGATIDGLIEYRSDGVTTTDATAVTPESIPFYVWFAYAGLFGKAKAGRPQHPWLVKMGKALETTKPDEDNEVECAQYAQFISLYNSLVTAK
jgi:hypothetical protein